MRRPHFGSSESSPLSGGKDEELRTEGRTGLSKGRRLVNFLAYLPDTIPLGVVRHPPTSALLTQERMEPEGAVSCLHIVTTPVVNAEAPADTEQTCWTV